jgi:hypothetical protein
MDEYFGAFQEKSRETMEAMEEVIDEKKSLIETWKRSYGDLIEGDWDESITRNNILFTDPF